MKRFLCEIFYVKKGVSKAKSTPQVLFKLRNKPHFDNIRSLNMHEVYSIIDFLKTINLKKLLAWVGLGEVCKKRFKEIVGLGRLGGGLQKEIFLIFKLANKCLFMGTVGQTATWDG